MRYFEIHDKDAKGSGFKPFMRWVERSEAYVKPDGTLQTVADFETELAKKNLQGRGLITDTSNWVPAGPFSHTNTGSWSSGQGRVNAITVDPNNSSVYYIATPGGGAFKSTDAGVTWAPLNDFITRVGASAVAVDPNNSNIVYVGTGDDDANDSPSIGLLKSLDGGATFNPTGLVFSQFLGADISEVYIDPTNSNKLVVSTDQGIYISTNAGVSFIRTFQDNVKDVKFKPGDVNTLYLSTNRNGFYKSSNGGSTWRRIFNGLPNNMGRTVIGVTPANPNYVYLLISDANSNYVGVYRSTNSGEFFRFRNTTTNVLESNQAWFDLALEVSPIDPNTVYTGCLNIWKSTSGGSSFTKVNNWSSPFDPAYTHADIHQIRQFGNELFALTDGGVYRSTNNANSFTDLTGSAQIGQFYRIAVGSNSANIAGGLQDNGGYVRSNNQWFNYYGADGMEAGILPGNDNTRYGFTQFGGGLYVTNDGRTLAGSINGPEQGNWITPLKTDRNGTIYAGYSALYKIENSGFTQVSGNFGALIDVLEIDTYDPNLIYIAINDQLYRSTNAGVNFTPVANMPGNITAIEASNTRVGEVFLATSGATGRVYKSSNYGSQFLDITANLPFLGKNTLAHQPNNGDDILFVGTTAGVMALDNTSSQWTAFDRDLPNINVRDLEINHNDNIMTAATYGRGVWQTGVPVSVPQVDLEITDLDTGSTGVPSCNSGGVQVIVRNNGATTISSVALDYVVDNGATQTQTFTVNLAPQQTTVLTLSVNTSSSTYDLQVDAQAANDSITVNNSTSGVVSRNESSVLNDVYGFANRTFITQGDNLWEVGVPSASTLNQAGSGSNNLAYATNVDGNYRDNQIGFLYTGCYDLSQVVNPFLEFEMAYEIESNYDVLYVEYTVDGGATWNLLGNSTDPNWYNSGNSSCALCTGGQWTGTNSTMQTYRQSLAPFIGTSNIFFRFVFESDQAVNFDGAVIDNLVVTGTLDTESTVALETLQVYPNPSSGIFKIGMSESLDLDVQVYSACGQEVLSQQMATKSSFEINLSGFARGVYFLKISSENGSTTRKLILN
jgi:hypothetical protein